MKGIKRKVVDTKEEVVEKIKNETSEVSEFSEEDDDKNVTFTEILQEDVFDKAQGDYNEGKKRNDVRENGEWQRREDGKSHDQESKSSGKDKEDGEKTSSEKESSTKNEIQEENEKIIFKHGIPKEISVFVTAKVTTLPYENIDISTGITLTLPPNANEEVTTWTRNEAYAYCEDFIAQKVREIRKSVAGVKK